jgi:acetyl esterase/lipase
VTVRAKRWIAGVCGALIVGLAGFVYVNRGKTRLRLADLPGEIVVTRDIVYVPGSPNPKHRLDAPAFFVLVGERDYPFMIPEAERARDRLRELGAPMEYLVVPGADHADMVLRFGARDDDVSAPIAAFVSRAAAPAAESN